MSSEAMSDGCRFRKPYPIGSRSAANQNMIAASLQSGCIRPHACATASSRDSSCKPKSWCFDRILQNN
jgi:hypothetical protein